MAVGRYKPAAQDDSEGKLELAEAALDATVASAKGGTQWAVVGTAPERKYVDFNKAMQGGTMNNLRMGQDVAEGLHAAFSTLAEEHRGLLTSAIAEASRVYDAGLDKTFCTDACSPSGARAERDEL